MNYCRRFNLLACVLAMMFGWSAKVIAADETTRTFAAQNCRFTLPGPDWKWSDKETPKLVFMALNSKGFVINLAVLETPITVELNDQFVKGFEKSVYGSSQLTKRTGEYIAFRGLKCYQLLSTLADGRTRATRVLVANKRLYNLNLVGLKEPIEAEPAFESIMSGFDFIVPPEQDSKQANSAAVQMPAQPTAQRPAQSEEYAKTLNFSQLMGKIVGGCLIGIVLLIIIRSVVRKKKSDQS
jgi:hypothetical protein